MWISSRGSQEYVSKVEALLKEIAGNPVGKVITQAIYGTKPDLVIRPMSEWKGDKKPKVCRAVTWDEDHSAAMPKGTGGKDADLRKKRYLGHADNDATDDNDERYDADTSGNIAVGGGSKALLYFTPDEWGESGCFPKGAGVMADEVLFHEMVHALRIMQGFSNPIPTVNTSYTNEEEFLAIVVANVYISSKDRTRPLKKPRSLVANHVSHDALWTPLNTSKGFLDDMENRKVMTIYKAEWKPTFRELGDLKTMVYNPFREAMNRKL